MTLEVPLQETEQDNPQTDETAAPVNMPKITKIEQYIFGKYDFRFNRVRLETEFREADKKECSFATFDMDKHLNDISIDLQKSGFSKPKENITELIRSSKVPEVHPIKDYFNSLKPISGMKEFKKLCGYVQLENLDISFEEKNYQELFEEYFFKWLMACYLCSMEKKHNDVMLILIGPQGVYKTSFQNYLCPVELAEYSVCGHIEPKMTEYLTAVYLTEKFLINVDDQMETIFGQNFNNMKAIVSATEITSRKKYGKQDKRRRRIANFCGSVNNPQFLTDNENRRYLCFQVKTIDKKYNTVDIRKLWSEVKYEAEKLKSWYLFGRNEYNAMMELSKYFSKPTTEEETLLRVFKPSTNNPENQQYFMQFSEILKVIRMVQRDNFLKDYLLRQAMSKHKFVSKGYRKKRFGDNSRYLYNVECIMTADQMRSKYAVDMTEYEDSADDEPNY